MPVVVVVVETLAACGGSGVGARGRKHLPAFFYFFDLNCLELVVVWRQ